MEKNRKAISAYMMLPVSLILMVAAIILFMTEETIYVVAGVACTLLFFLSLVGYFIVNPNESMVLILFGKYTGTVKRNGFFWVNPFYKKRKVSLRASNFDSERIK